MSKTPYEIAEYKNEGGSELKDMQIFDTSQTFTIASKRAKRRVIYQYRAKRARLDLLNIEKALAKAEKMVAGQIEAKRNRFLKISRSSKEINHELVRTSREKAGIKGYVTNLDIAPSEIIDAYHQLFKVEKAFRMAKTDVKARPVFHHQRDSIEAHLTIVFAALAVMSFIELNTGLSIRRFINMMKPLRSGIVRIGNKTLEIEPAVSKATQEIVKKLTL